MGVQLYTDDGNLRPLEEIEADGIRLAIGHYRGRMTEVARRLGIGRSTLYRKLGDLGIESAQVPDEPPYRVSQQGLDRPAISRNPAQHAVLPERTPPDGRSALLQLLALSGCDKRSVGPLRGERTDHGAPCGPRPIGNGHRSRQSG